MDRSQSRRFPLACLLLVLGGAPSLAACSSTTQGTSTGGTDGGAASDDTERSSAQGACASLAGSWRVNGCALDECSATQTGCEATVTCTGAAGTFTASLTVAGSSFTGTCTGSVDATTGLVDASCSVASGGKCDLTGQVTGTGGEPDDTGCSSAITCKDERTQTTCAVKSGVPVHLSTACMAMGGGTCDAKGCGACTNDSDCTPLCSCKDKNGATIGVEYEGSCTSGRCAATDPKSYCPTACQAKGYTY